VNLCYVNLSCFVHITKNTFLALITYEITRVLGVLWPETGTIIKNIYIYIYIYIHIHIYIVNELLNHRDGGGDKEEDNNHDDINGYSIYWLHIVHQALCAHAKSLQSCLTLFDPMDCSVPDSSAHGILQARALEWVAVSSSRLGSLHCVYSML